MKTAPSPSNLGAGHHYGSYVRADEIDDLEKRCGIFPERRQYANAERQPCDLGVIDRQEILKYPRHSSSRQIVMAGGLEIHQCDRREDGSQYDDASFSYILRGR